MTTTAPLLCHEGELNLLGYIFASLNILHALAYHLICCRSRSLVACCFASQPAVLRAWILVFVDGRCLRLVVDWMSRMWQNSISNEISRSMHLAKTMKLYACWMLTFSSTSYHEFWLSSSPIEQDLQRPREQKSALLRSFAYVAMQPCLHHADLS